MTATPAIHYLYLRDDKRNPDRIVTIARQIRDGALYVTYAMNRCGKRRFYVPEGDACNVYMDYDGNLDPFSKEEAHRICEQRLLSGENVVELRGNTHPLVAIYEALRSTSRSTRVQSDATGISSWPPTVRRLMFDYFFDTNNVNPTVLRQRYKNKGSSVYQLLNKQLSAVEERNFNLENQVTFLTVLNIILFVLLLGLRFS
jgi:hypothetical protein